MDKLLKRIYRWINIRKHRKINAEISNDNESLLTATFGLLNMLSTIDCQVIPYHKIVKYRILVRSDNISDHLRVTKQMLSVIERGSMHIDQIFNNKGGRRYIRLEAWLVNQSGDIYINRDALSMLFPDTMELILSIKETANIKPVLYEHYLHLIKPYLYEVIDILNCNIAAQLDIPHINR